MTKRLPAAEVPLVTDEHVGRPAAPAPRTLWSRVPYGLKAKLGVGAVLLVLWEVGIRFVAPPYVARPQGIVTALPEVLTSPGFIQAFLGTMVPVVQGLIIAISLAVVVGLAMGRVQWIGWALGGPTKALFALPMVAVVPLATMMLGYSEEARLAIVVFAAYFPMVINVYDGARAVPARYLEVAATYRASRPSVFGVVLPASIPYLLAGFRLASGRALVGVVVAEFLISIDGLGFFILRNARSFNHDQAFVAVLVLALVGIAVMVLARWATRRLAPWYEAERG